MKKINKKATLGVGLAMFALADPTQVFNFNNSTLDSTVIKVEAQTSYVKPASVAEEVTTTIKTWSEDGMTGYTADGTTIIDKFASDKSGVYYFNKSGVKVTGLVPVGSDYYYFEEETGKAVTGLVEVDGKTYYFKTNGKSAKKEAVKYIGEDKTTSYYYFDENGEMVTSKIVNITSTNKGDSGLITDDGGDFCFGEDGKLVQSGLCTATIGDDEKLYTFYVNAKDVATKTEGGSSDQKAKQIVKSRFKLIDGSIYYFNKDGKMVTGVQEIGSDDNTIDGSSNILNKKTYGSGTYYFNAAGEMQTGLINVSVFEDFGHAGIYYFGDNGAAVSGWIAVGSDRYYFDETSHKAKIGEYTDSDKEYYFDENGVMVTGFQTVDGKTYYYSEATIDLGQKVKGKKEINGIKYTFDDETGRMVTGFTDDEKYYYNEEGQRVTGWFTDKGKTYYASPEKNKDGEIGEIQTGFVEIDGTKYYFATKTAADNTSFTKGEMLKGVQTINKKVYFLGENTGRVVTGWVTADKDGKNYYMDEDGVIKTGWLTINGLTYYLDPNSKADGAMAAGAMATGLRTITTSKSLTGNYYFGNDGVMRVGFQNVDGHTYYFNEQYSSTDGERGKKLLLRNELGITSGITEINREEYYLDKSGEIVTGWLTVGNSGLNDGTTYYMNSRGIVQKGWQTIDGTRYYFDKDSGILAKGIKEINGDYYFFGENTGRLVTGLVTADAKDSQGNRKVFYMNERGVIQTGFITIGGTTYYFSETGTAALNSTAETKGQMLRGIQTIEGKNYFLGENTGRVVTGWITADMKDKNGNNMIFYMNGKGVIQTGFITIDGTTYYFATAKSATDDGEVYGQMLKGTQSILPTGAKKKITYFLGENTGRVVTGWITADKDGRRYYMNEKGEIQTDIVSIDGKKYYFNEYGQLETNTVVQAKDSKIYILDENGVATEQKKA